MMKCTQIYAFKAQMNLLERENKLVVISFIQNFLVDKVKKGESEDGQKWTAYFIHTATGGEYGTFSQTIADKATTYAKEGKLVRLRSKPSKKGREVVSIEDDAA